MGAFGVLAAALKLGVASVAQTDKLTLLQNTSTYLFYLFAITGCYVAFCVAGAASKSQDHSSVAAAAAVLMGCGGCIDFYFIFYFYFILPLSTTTSLQMCKQQNPDLINLLAVKRAGFCNSE